MNNMHLEEAKQHAEAAKKGTTDLAAKIVNAIAANPEKAEDYIVNLRETLIEIYQNGRWDGMKDATNVLTNGTLSEKNDVKQSVTKSLPYDGVKLGLPCTVCGSYSDAGQPCGICEIRKKRGMMPS